MRGGRVAAGDSSIAGMQQAARMQKEGAALLASPLSCAESHLEQAFHGFLKHLCPALQLRLVVCERSNCCLHACNIGAGKQAISSPLCSCAGSALRCGLVTGGKGPLCPDSCSLCISSGAPTCRLVLQPIGTLLVIARPVSPKRAHLLAGLGVPAATIAATLVVPGCLQLVHQKLAVHC